MSRDGDEATADDVRKVEIRCSVREEDVAPTSELLAAEIHAVFCARLRPPHEVVVEVAANIVRGLLAAAPRLRLHGFGFKQRGIAALGAELESADSLSWSYQARRAPPMSGHASLHKNCANCFEYAMAWRERLLSRARGSA